MYFCAFLFPISWKVSCDITMVPLLFRWAESNGELGLDKPSPMVIHSTNLSFCCVSLKILTAFLSQPIYPILSGYLESDSDAPLMFLHLRFFCTLLDRCSQGAERHVFPGGRGDGSRTSFVFRSSGLFILNDFNR